MPPSRRRTKHKDQSICILAVVIDQEVLTIGPGCLSPFTVHNKILQTVWHWGVLACTHTANHFLHSLLCPKQWSGVCRQFRKLGGHHPCSCRWFTGVAGKLLQIRSSFDSGNFQQVWIMIVLTSHLYVIHVKGGGKSSRAVVVSLYAVPSYSIFWGYLLDIFIIFKNYLLLPSGTRDDLHVWYWRGCLCWNISLPSVLLSSMKPLPATQSCDYWRCHSSATIEDATLVQL